MNPLWLLLIVPVSFGLGIVFQALQNNKPDTGVERENWGAMKDKHDDPEYRPLDITEKFYHTQPKLIKRVKAIN